MTYQHVQVKDYWPKRLSQKTKKASAQHQKKAASESHEDEDKSDGTNSPLVAAGSTQGGHDDDDDEDDDDDFDRARRAHLNATGSSSDSSGWRDELTRYLEATAEDVTSDTNIVEWWHVSHFILFLAIPV